MLSILNSCHVEALISFINCPDDRYIDIHTALLNACARSSGCKRLIPSEWAGNIDDYPWLPRFYAAKRDPFRQVLRESKGVEWTLFNCGWLMDYFLPSEKTYMPPIPDEFPVDPNNWRYRVRGTGDELQSWTCAREIGRAVVELLAAPEWVRADESTSFPHISDDLFSGAHNIRCWRMEHVQRGCEDNGNLIRLDMARS